MIDLLFLISALFVPSAHSVSPHRSAAIIVEHPATFEGEVMFRRHEPVQGAVVVTSAGGQAVTDSQGRFRLVLPDAARGSRVRLTAVTTHAGRNLSCTLELVAPRGGVVHVNPLLLQATASCSPSWIPTFGGEPGVDGVSAFVVFDDGTGPALFVGGMTTAGGQAMANIAKWNGASWSPLGAGVDWIVRSICVFDDGSGPALYVGGWFSNAGGAPASRIARWNGTAWSTLGSGLNGAVNTLLVFDDGSGSALYVGGDFTTAGGVAAERVAKWNGSTWSALGVGLGSTTLGNKQVYALAAFDDGTGMALYAGGRITHTGTTPISIVSKWNGSIWQSVGNQFAQGGGSFDSVVAMTVFDDGNGPALYVGGDFNTLGSTPIRDLAKWNGSVWTALGSGILGWSVSALTVYDDGAGPQLYAAGDFWTVGGMSINDLARWNGSSWSAFGTGSPEVSTPYSQWTFGQYDDGSGPALFLGGGFLTAGGVPAEHIAKWQASTWSALGSGTYDHALGLIVFDDGHGPVLHAAFQIGTSQHVRFARWTGSDWFVTGPDFQNFHTFGIFDAGNGPALHVATDAGLLRWNGSSWAPLPGGNWTRDIGSLAVFDDGSGPKLYAGGYFTVNDGAPANYLARWDGSAWTALGTPFDNEVTCVATLDDGNGPTLYASGTFSTAGGQPAPHIVKWNGSGWTALGSGLDYPQLPPYYIYARAMTMFDDGNGRALYVAGSFTTAGGIPASNIAKWDGSQWLALGTGLDDVATDVLVHDDGNGPALYSIGEFLTAGGVPVAHMARWDGSGWSSFGFPNDFVGGITIFDQHDGLGSTLVIGGTFAVSPAGDSHIARLGGCSPSSGTPYCFGDGTGTACPCGNTAPAGYQGGCVHSLGFGARLTSFGTPSLVHDSLVLDGSEMPNSSCLYFQGTTQVAAGLGAVFGDGLRCAGGTIVRLARKTNSGGTSHYPEGPDLPVSVRGSVASGSVHTYQVWYRNAASFCSPSTFNLTNGLVVTWHP